MTTDFEARDSAPSPQEGLIRRFSTMLGNVTPTTTSVTYDGAAISSSWLRLLIKPPKKLLQHDITKQTASHRVDNKEHLTGLYRQADWGEITVEHILIDTITDIASGRVVQEMPERYRIEFVDHVDWHAGDSHVTSYGVEPVTEDYTTSEVAFSYDFIPAAEQREMAITPDRGPNIQPGDGNYAYFLRALELAEIYFADNPSK